MRHRVVLYPEGSPVASLAAGLPPEFDRRAVRTGAVPALARNEDAVLLMDADSDPPEPIAVAAGRRDGIPVIALMATPPAAVTLPASWYACLPKPVAAPVLARALSNAFEHIRMRGEAEETRRQLEELNAIGVRLSAERDVDALFALILSLARAITHSDAGSIYLVEEPDGEPRRLRFQLSQNDSVSLAATYSGGVLTAAAHVPVNEESIAGYVALTGETVHLADAYAPPSSARYRINTAFDRHAGYRTKSMLVVPMRTPTGDIIGVLQLINCKPDRARRFASPEEIEREALPYPERFISLAASLASQAAVALENSRLYESVRVLFEGFVSASVTAIESRDPTTSGHSFRVADLTVALAQAAHRAEVGPFRDLRFSPDEIREIRYASLLHDFGKVGVREDVLVKAKKLPPLRLELIRQRAELLKRGLELRYARQKVDRLLKGAREGFEAQAAMWDLELTALLGEIDNHLATVGAANEPAVMPADAAAGIRSIAVRAFVDHVGNVCPSGFLQLPAGNLRKQSFIEIYRNSPVFRQLRDYSQLKGKCGACDFRDVCGGSRARAFGVTGDYMESEPYCVYVSPEAREKGLTAPPPWPRQRPDADYVPLVARG